MSNLPLRLERTRTGQFAGGMNEADNVGCAIGFATDQVDPAAEQGLQTIGQPTVNNGIGGAAGVAVEIAEGTHEGKDVQVQEATGSTAPDAQIGLTGFYNRSTKTLASGERVLGSEV